MALAAGTRLGPYEVQAALGAGGMGEVYQARDPRLDRTVAIKVLPAELSADPERRARFEREARTIAALNHPHICTLHDIGQHDGTTYLVMEHLAGETLAQRLRKGPLPIAQALEVGAQIADALDAAHKQGIVHRDLKPANVMLTKSGAKLLDFGLAKLRPGGAIRLVPDSSAAATHTGSVTVAGTLVGTIPYMAPEQVEGREADARTDLWALGCLLYEMVTGHRAFEGETAASVAAAILDREPEPVTAVQPLTPPALEHVVTMCLAKDPDARWQAASDVAREMRWIADERRLGRMPATGQLAEIVAAVPMARRGHRLRHAVRGGAAALLLFGLGAGTVWLLGQRSQPRLLQFRRSVITTSPADELGGRLDDGSRTMTRAALAISPDGNVLAFTAAQTGQAPQLYVRRSSDETARALPDTQGAEWPFFSPDGAWLGFWADDQVKKIRLDGGPPVRVCDVDNGLFGASWAPDGTIVFAGQIGPLMAVSPSSHEPRPLTRIPPGNQEVHRLPHVLPDGTGVLFTVLDAAPFSLAEWETARVEIMTFATAERQIVLKGAEDGRYLPTGHLLYARGDAVEAVHFDLASRRTTGSPAGILKGSSGASTRSTRTWRREPRRWRCPTRARWCTSLAALSLTRNGGSHGSTEGGDSRRRQSRPVPTFHRASRLTAAGWRSVARERSRVCGFGTSCDPT